MRRVLLIACWPFWLFFLVLRSLDWMIHWCIYHVGVTLLPAIFERRERLEPSAPSPPPLLPFSLPRERFEIVREPSAHHDSQYLSGSRLTSFYQLRDRSRSYWDAVEEQDREDFSDAFPMRRDR